MLQFHGLTMPQIAVYHPVTNNTEIQSC